MDKNNKNIQVNETQTFTGSHLDSMLAYGPYNLGIVNIEKSYSSENSPIKDLTK